MKVEEVEYLAQLDVSTFWVKENMYISNQQDSRGHKPEHNVLYQLLIIELSYNDIRKITNVQQVQARRDQIFFFHTIAFDFY